MANLLFAHRDLANPRTAPKWRRCGAWPTCRRAPARRRWKCSRPSADGEIKALWIACTNPAQSMPDQATVRARAASAPSSSSCRKPLPTPTPCDYADLLLPATTWGEKEGTVTNSERRITRVRAAVAAPGEARARLGDRGAISRSGWERGCGRGAPQRCSPTQRRRSEVWNEHRESTRGRDLDITGLVLRAARSAARSSGRCPRVRASGKARLYEDGIFPTPDGRARFVDRCLPARGRAARCALSASPQHRPPARPVARHEPHRHAGPAVRPCGRAARADARRRTWRGASCTTATWCTSRASAAPSSCRCRPTPAGRAGAGLHRHALGRGVPERPSRRTGERLRGRQRADHLGLLPHLQAARAQARGGEDPQGRDAVDACWPWPGCQATRPWPRASRCRR